MRRHRPRAPPMASGESPDAYHGRLVQWAIGRSDLDRFVQAVVRLAVDRLEAVSSDPKPDRKAYMRDLMRKRRAAQKTATC